MVFTGVVADSHRWWRCPIKSLMIGATKVELFRSHSLFTGLLRTPTVAWFCPSGKPEVTAARTPLFNSAPISPSDVC